MSFNLALLLSFTYLANSTHIPTITCDVNCGMYCILRSESSSRWNFHLDERVPRFHRGSGCRDSHGTLHSAALRLPNWQRHMQVCVVVYDTEYKLNHSSLMNSGPGPVVQSLNLRHGNQERYYSNRGARHWTSRSSPPSSSPKRRANFKAVAAAISRRWASDKFPDAQSSLTRWSSPRISSKEISGAVSEVDSGAEAQG